MTIHKIAFVTILMSMVLNAQASILSWDKHESMQKNDVILTLTTLTPDNEDIIIYTGTQTEYTVYGKPEDFTGNPCDNLQASKINHVPTTEHPTAKIDAGINYVNSQALKERFGEQLLCFKMVEEIWDAQHGISGIFISGPFQLISDEAGNYIQSIPNEWTTNYTSY